MTKFVVLLAIFAAVVITCVSLANAAPNETLLEQMEQSISGAFGGWS